MSPDWKTPFRRWCEKVEFGTDDGCWTWTARCDEHGYGYFMQRPDKCVSAHRYGYTMLVGDVPLGLVLDHLCRNPWCVNPAHLEPVTQAENVRRGRSGHVNREKTHCPSGHPYSGSNVRYSTSTDRHGRSYRRRECIACIRRRSQAAYAARRAA